MNNIYRLTILVALAVLQERAQEPQKIFRDMDSHYDEWELDTQKYLDFWTESDKPEDLVAILRAHLYIEAELLRLLQVRYPELSTAFTERLRNYQHKVAWTKYNDLLPERYRATLTEIGNLRNRFAHATMKRDINEDDLMKLKATLSPELAHAVNHRPSETLYGAHDIESPSGKVRIILMVVFNWLCSYVAAQRSGLGAHEPPP